MKITYTGQAAFTPAQQKKLDTKFSKVSKLLDKRGEKGVHVILTMERHLHQAEITVNYFDHAIVVTAAHADLMQAVTGAVEKLEKQVLRLREKQRDTKRTPEAKAVLNGGGLSKKAKSNGAPEAASKAGKTAKPSKAVKNGKEDADRRVFRQEKPQGKKPMTVEEAMLEFGDKQDYVVYRDAESDRMHVLVKRRDGHFDLIES